MKGKPVKSQRQRIARASSLPLESKHALTAKGEPRIPQAERKQKPKPETKYAQRALDDIAREAVADLNSKKFDRETVLQRMDDWSEHYGISGQKLDDMITSFKQTHRQLDQALNLK